METHNTGVVSSNPARVTIKTPIVRKLSRRPEKLGNQCIEENIWCETFQWNLEYEEQIGKALFTEHGTLRSIHISLFANPLNIWAINSPSFRSLFSWRLDESVSRRSYVILILYVFLTYSDSSHKFESHRHVFTLVHWLSLDLLEFHQWSSQSTYPLVSTQSRDGISIDISVSSLTHNKKNTRRGNRKISRQLTYLGTNSDPCL